MSVAIDCARTFIDVLGVRTACYRRGTGRTLVLMHGSSPGACSELNWFRNFDALADAGFDVIAFDQPGYGYSAAPADHSIEFRYRHAEALLEALDVREAVLVGNSLGGLLAVLLAHRADPSRLRVDGLVLAAQYPHFEIPADVRAAMQKHIARLSSLEPEYDSVKTLTMNTLANHVFLTDDLIRLRLAMLERNYQAYKERGKTGMGFEAEAVRAQPVSTPALIVWGIDDHSLPLEIGLEAMRHFTNARFLFLPHCGHWPQTEHANTFNRALEGFVSELPGALPA